MKTLHLMFSMTLLAVIGCEGGGIDSVSSTSQTGSVRGEVEVQFPPGWVPKKEIAPFDLLWENEPSHLTTGLVVYDKTNPTNRSPDETLQFHLDELQKKYRSFQITQDKFESTIDTRRFVRVHCTADNGNPAEVFPHRVTLVEFSDSKVFVVAIQASTTTSSSTNFTETEPVFASITESIRRPVSDATK